MRLTAGGKFHLWLHNDDQSDVRKALRSGASTAQIGEILVRAVTQNPPAITCWRAAPPRIAQCIRLAVRSQKLYGMAI